MKCRTKHHPTCQLIKDTCTLPHRSYRLIPRIASEPREPISRLDSRQPASRPTNPANQMLHAAPQVVKLLGCQIARLIENGG